MQCTSLTRAEFLNIYDYYLRESGHAKIEHEINHLEGTLPRSAYEGPRGYDYDWHGFVRRKQEEIGRQFNVEFLPEPLANSMLYSAYLIRGKPNDFYDRREGMIPSFKFEGTQRRKRFLLSHVIENSDVYLCAEAALFDLMSKSRDWIDTGDYFVYLSVDSLHADVVVNEIMYFTECYRAIYHITDYEDEIVLRMTHQYITERFGYNLMRPKIQLNEEVRYLKDFTEQDIKDFADAYLIMLGKTSVKSMEKIMRYSDLPRGRNLTEREIARVNFSLYRTNSDVITIPYDAVKKIDDELTGKDTYELISPRN